MGYSAEEIAAWNAAQSRQAATYSAEEIAAWRATGQPPSTWTETRAGEAGGDTAGTITAWKGSGDSWKGSGDSWGYYEEEIAAWKAAEGGEAEGDRFPERNLLPEGAGELGEN